MKKTEHIELRVAQIISTDKRKEILNVIIARQNEFTVSDVFRELKNKKVDIKLTAVLNVVKSLHYAGFLSEKVEVKESRKEGRPKNLYKVVPGVVIALAAAITT